MMLIKFHEWASVYWCGEEDIYGKGNNKREGSGGQFDIRCCKLSVTLG